jgi:hypothetical protein
MKIYYNVLSEKLLNICKSDILENQKKSIWLPNLFNWDPDLVLNLDGISLSMLIGNKVITTLLTQELYSGPLKNLKGKISYQYYIWNAYSGIQPHSDASYEFAATIYLNSNKIEDGGLFLWQDDHCKENFYKCLNPQENMMVVNDSEQEHFVTPVSPHRKEPRYTIQVFSRLNE